MKTLTTKDLNQLVFTYILDDCIPCVEDLRNEYNVSLINDKERVSFVYETFKENANHPYNLQRFPNEIERFGDWLRGVPGVMDVDQWNESQIHLAKKWGSIPQNATESQENKIVNNFYNFIANKFFQLKKRLEKREFLNA